MLHIVPRLFGIPTLPFLSYHLSVNASPPKILSVLEDRPFESYQMTFERLFQSTIYYTIRKYVLSMSGTRVPHLSRQTPSTFVVLRKIVCMICLT